jgi:hypothetical protein
MEDVENEVNNYYSVVVSADGHIDEEILMFDPHATMVSMDLSASKSVGVIEEFIQNDRYLLLKSCTRRLQYDGKGGDLDGRPEVVFRRNCPASAANIIAHMLNPAIFSQLSELVLRYLYLPKESIHTLCDSLHPLKGRLLLRKLTMYRCELNDGSVAALTDALRGNSTLRSLDLTANRIKNGGIQAIANCLSYYSMKVEFLAVGNNLFGNEGKLTEF